MKFMTNSMWQKQNKNIHMKKNILFGLIALSGLIIFSIRCTKPASNLHVPPEYAHFIGDELQTYSIEINPAPVYIVQVGLTDVSDKDRTVTFNVTSPTGAVAGTHYTLLTTGNTITIPAGETIAEIGVQGSFAPYTSGRKDTLIFSLQSPSVSPAPFSDTVKLVLRGPCFDGDITIAELNSLLGAYNNTKDAGDFGTWGPYTATVVSVTQLTPTTARAVINNVWDAGLGNVNFILDWSDPNNTYARVESETITPANAGNLNPAYNGMNIVIADHPGVANTSKKFSVCNGRFSLRYAFGVFDPGSGTVLGYFSNVGMTNLQR